MLAATRPLSSAGPPSQDGAVETASSSEPSKTPFDDTNTTANTDSTSKKTYLSLLPPAQIIEICLLFEPHVPVHVKSTVWPADLQAAILELKKTSQSSSPETLSANTATPRTSRDPSTSNVGTPSHQVHPPGPPGQSVADSEPPMGSLRKPAEEARTKATWSDPGATATSAPSPAPQPKDGVALTGQSVSAPSQSQPGPSQPGTGASASAPQPHVQPQQANLHTPGAYPYAPYPYTVPQPQAQQSAYPHVPYYAPPPAYPSHYPYPPYAPPPGYTAPAAPAPGHSPPPPSHHGQHPLFNSTPLVRPQLHPSGLAPQPPPPPSEDLPSYEEMIVEALLDCGDSEGAAPKDLFTWMAARYPLQTNFRPSASQALQKAFKRGRLEKLASGKYRLNPSWEGGATSKRTTRRPQTLAQTTYAMHHPPAQSSPFTHAPLQQHPHPPAPGAQPPYTGYPYPYPYSHYPGYPPHPQPGQAPQQLKSASQAPPAAPTGASAAVGAGKNAQEKDDAGEGSDAWEAAQHILKAINFRSLELSTGQSNNPSSTTSAAGQSSQNASGASTSGADAPPSVAPSGEADLSAVLNALMNAADRANATAEPPRATLTEDERAALQAQLALLAAQLTEIAEGEDEEEPAAAPSATPRSTHAAQPTEPSQGSQQPSAPASQSPQSAPLAHSAHLPSQSAPHRSEDLPPPPIAAYAGRSHVVLDVNAFPEAFPSTAPRSDRTDTGEPSAPASGHQTEVDELADDESDEDDDMEDVVVPLHPSAHAAQDSMRT